MKKALFAILLFAGASFFCAAEGIAEDSRQGRETADMSYAFGMVVASDLAGTGLEFDYGAFTRGFRDIMESEKTRYSMDEAMDKIQTAFSAAQAAIGERNLSEGAAFLSANAGKPGIVTAPSGLQYEMISEGEGEMPDSGDVVLVHYRGATLDGAVFDNTYDDGKPIEIPLDRVIPGWSEGLRMMREGGRAKLYIPPNLAYGDRGMGGVIGPNAVLVFDVELISIVSSGYRSVPDYPDDLD